MNFPKITALPTDSQSLETELHAKPNVRLSTPEEIAAMDSFIKGEPEALRSDVAASQLALLLMSAQHIHRADQHRMLSQLMSSTQAWKEIAELQVQYERGLITGAEWLLAMVRHCSWIDAELKRWSYTTSSSKTSSQG